MFRFQNYPFISNNPLSLINPDILIYFCNWLAVFNEDICCWRANADQIPKFNDFGVFFKNIDKFIDKQRVVKLQDGGCWQRSTQLCANKVYDSLTFKADWHQ